MSDTVDEDQRPPLISASRRQPLHDRPLASRRRGKNRQPRGEDCRRSNGYITIKPWGHAQYNNLPVRVGDVVTEAAGVVEKAVMTTATAADFVRWWCVNREGKWKRLLSYQKRSGRHTNEGGTPDKR